MTEILTPVSSDHFPVLFSLKRKTPTRGKAIWKFNSSSTKDQNYITNIMKN